MSIFDKLFGKKEKPFKEEGKGHNHCDFGIKEFNKTKRSKEFVDELRTPKVGKGRPGKTTTSTTTQDPSITTTTTAGPVTSSANVLYLEFDGVTVSGTPWNTSGNIVTAPSGLLESEREIILQNTKDDYSPYNVLVTRDISIFNATPKNKRMKCIITESWEWYCGSSPCAGGVAYLGSFDWSDDTPCWVFSSALAYNTKYVQEAVSHELGHTLGLRHQADYSDTCALESAYNYGCCGEAPIMGVGYYQPVVRWWIGPTVSCTSIQDDNIILTNKLGLK